VVLNGWLIFFVWTRSVILWCRWGLFEACLMLGFVRKVGDEMVAFVLYNPLSK